MEHSDLSLAQMITRRFRRWGKSGSTTGLLRDLEGKFDEFLKDNVTLVPNEQIVVVTVQSQDNWSILTTRRLVCVHQGRQFVTCWNGIADIDSVPSSRHGPIDNDIQLTLSRLCVTDEQGEKIIIVTEPGAPCFGFWNALRLAQQLGAVYK